MPLIPIVFPDVELVLTGVVRAGLASHGFGDVFVSNKRGSQAMAVWIRGDGGPVQNHARKDEGVGVNVYAPTEQEAFDLASVVAALVRAAADGDPIIRVKQDAGPYPVADAAARLYMTFTVTVRGTEL